MLVPTRTPDIDYRAAGFWENRTLSSFLDEAAASHPDETAITTEAEPITYRQLRDAAAGMAGALSAHGVRRHDVVTVFMPNWPEASIAIHAASWAGAVVNPVVSTYRRAELSYIMRQSGTRAVFIPHVFRGFDYVAMLSDIVAAMTDPPLVFVARPRGTLPEGFVSFDGLVAARRQTARSGEPTDICLLLFTSGTTSEPKGVLHSHQTIIWEMRSIIREFGLCRQDRIFMPSPIGHLTGIVYGVYLPSVLAQSVSLLDAWDPESASRIIEQHGCRVCLGATPFLRGLTSLYRQRGITSSLRLFLCGGADVPPTLVTDACRALDAIVTRTYGSSELPTFSVSGPAAPIEMRSCTDGEPIAPNQGRLLGPRDGVGELAVRGPEMFLGYLDASLNDAAFTPDGFFRTGDLVEFDESGALTVRGRIKDIIIRGGENISALEVENHLRAHDAVEDAVVVGYPDEDMGARVAAFLVLRAECGAALSVDDVGAHLKSLGLAAHKRPERVEVVSELPRTASGKVLKQQLQQQLSETRTVS
ncbi:cyclohexanecarboxylate-CoA ligase [Mycolicibacterium moriokaense]|nr:cyclohexanecarboxylate-CoA ligase [Mycolicibacterium moriokaense]